MAKLLTVFGATGQQGGSLIEFVLQNSKLSQSWSLRGITRDVTKPRATALKERGVEMVQADMNDVESLRKAVDGSYAVFAVTNYWDPPPSASREIAQGKAMADAAVAAKAQLLIWSSLPNVTEMTGGKLTGVVHFDSKAEVERYIRGLDITSVFYFASFYMQNMETFFAPKKDPTTGALEYRVSYPSEVSLPLIDIKDTGLFLEPILSSQETEPSKYHHARFIAATAYYDGNEIVDGWNRVTGRGVSFVHDPGNHAGLPEEVKKMMKEAAGLMSEWEYYGPTGRKDLEWTLDQLNDKPTSWEDFVRRVEESREGGWFG